MRTIITLVYIAVFLIISLPVSGIQWLIAPRDKQKRDKMILCYVQWMFRCVEKLSGSTVTVQGLENIPKDRPVLYIGNHQSFFDIVVTYSRLPGLTGFISKQNVFKVPLLGWLMKRLHCLGIDRSSLRSGLNTVLESIDEIKHGVSIFIYPEGTRSKDGKVHEFHAGSFKIATKAKCPVVPVAVNGTRDILEYHFPNIKKSHVTLTFGEPIETRDMSREEIKELPNRVRDQIIDMMG
ncbi:MAG: 1-acyl-sn-glycerol-3-phosphate acyltransferase [Lachnospiraceae bacterium]|uniref:1-acyl-sn-glycerol-3-phosphate acyltransferase n=1 Tax=Candidatus Weimeria bifida TaxID=2599074 RepID=A0A6N7J2W0_9FIRM|nr:1-acyl-sn-glycerol-3-phosphate acyltransferase [Candidatus Weimeria bifida]RRF96406.1 MAG: 1-acyl-sn-glycerol-3-phosphate acyltransferase [Lachnospiraceae bacterium]